MPTKRKTKIFVGIAAKIENGKVSEIVTSDGRAIRSSDGIIAADYLDFLFDLRGTARDNTIFVSYGFSQVNEFLFAEMVSEIKDKLFQSSTIKKEVNQIETDLEACYFDLEQFTSDTLEYELADFERYVNELALAERGEISYNGYKIVLRNGRSISITKDKKRIVVFDCFGFFESPLSVAVDTWLDERLPVTVSLYQESDTVARLAEELHGRLMEHGINLRSYYGSGSVASWILGKAKAKTYFNSYRHKRQLSDDIYNAIYQAYYSGRAEQFKLGKIDKPIFVYDINSAYAHAITFLPVLLERLKFSEHWKPDIFSLWHCDYDFTSVNPYFGFLPHRERGGSGTFYKTKGRGFFWQPEVCYILNRFPDCIEINGGYSLSDYEVAPFTELVKDIYALRVQLKQQDNPLQTILKTALASVYGKFCQQNKRGYYYNRMYAGFITSLTRMQLLQATENNESEVICFLTDAIHSTKPLDVPLNNDLGGFRLKTYDRGFYIDNGIYQVSNSKITKNATKGFRDFDFEQAKKDFLEKYSYTGSLNLFIGYNLYSLLPFHNYKYLETETQTRTAEPLTARARSFFQTDGIYNSRILTNDSGLESALYAQGDHIDFQNSIDALISRI